MQRSARGFLVACTGVLQAPKLTLPLAVGSRRLYTGTAGAAAAALGTRPAAAPGAAAPGGPAACHARC